MNFWWWTIFEIWQINITEESHTIDLLSIQIDKYEISKIQTRNLIISQAKGKEEPNVNLSYNYILVQGFKVTWFIYWSNCSNKKHESLFLWFLKEDLFYFL